MRESSKSLALGFGAAALLLGLSACAERSPVRASSSADTAILMECNTGRINCRKVARYSTLQICNRERANYTARNPLREAYCTTAAAAKR